MLPWKTGCKKLAVYAETFLFNKIEPGERSLGIIATGISYQYAREVFPNASFLKLGMTYPLPEKLIAGSQPKPTVSWSSKKLDPFIEDHIKAMGIKCEGKQFIPRCGELNTDILEAAGRKMGIIKTPAPEKLTVPAETGQTPAAALSRLSAHRIFLRPRRHWAAPQTPRRQRKSPR